MKSIKRPLSLLLCAALVLGLLAGCGEQVETTPSSAQTEGPTTQATAEPTTEPVETLRTEHREQLDPDGFLLRTTDSVYDSQDRLVEEYKKAANWSAMADKIKPISALEGAI